LSGPFDGPTRKFARYSDVIPEHWLTRTGVSSGSASKPVCGHQFCGNSKLDFEIAVGVSRDEHDGGDRIEHYLQRQALPTIERVFKPLLVLDVGAPDTEVMPRRKRRSVRRRSPTRTSLVVLPEPDQR
jgi:hypothetical protein